MTDPIKHLGDLIAVQDEHSHVDASVRLRIRKVITAGPENEELGDTARRIVDGLPERDLASLVADWLEIQVAI